jgi:site-specific recombinase XerD
MLTHNPENERIKRAYFAYLAEAQGFSEATVDAVAKAINRFETYTKFRDFKAFHIEQAKAFKTGLAEQMSLRTKERLSKATLYATLNALKRFFVWLAGQPGFRSRISYSDAEYFNLSAKEARVARARRGERMPTLEQIRHVINEMPTATEIDLRNRALIAFTMSRCAPIFRCLPGTSFTSAQPGARPDIASTRTCWRPRATNRDRGRAASRGTRHRGEIIPEQWAR